MKPTRLLLALPLLAIAALLASAFADAPTIVDNLTTIQTGQNNTLIQSFWQKTIDLHDGTGPVPYGPLVQTSWPASASGTVSITLADGSVASVSYSGVLAATLAIATQEHNK